MRRIRRDATKVWHNPEITGRRADVGAAHRPQQQPSPEDRRAATQHRAALEALFAPKRDEADSTPRAPSSSGGKAAQRIVLPPAPQSDPKTAERQKLLAKLLAAEGRPAVSKTANEFLRAGFSFPDDQDVHLKLLEHADEERVRVAIEALSRLLAGELPHRRAVLESRLRRIEEFAEDGPTRDAAAQLRRRVAGRPDRRSAPSGDSNG